jgi:hypothetical protein
VRGQRIDRDGVIARHRGEITRTLAVLEDDDPITAQAADHWPRRGRTDARDRHTGLALEAGGEGCLEFSVECGTGEHSRGTQHLLSHPLGEGACHHGGCQLHGRWRERETELGLLAGGHRDASRDDAISDPPNRERVPVRRYVAKLEAAVFVRPLLTVELDEADLNGDDRCAGGRVHHHAAHRGPGR